ncbi:MAG: alginate export family protein [Deltaproteobacteria bacterium]|nr:alginate export family protein [Deltaproteobacteria bacterium]
MVPGASRAADELPLLSIKLGKKVEFIPHLEYRPRFIGHSGKDFKAGPGYHAVTHRARLGLEAKLFEWASVMIQAQDVRTWGEELDPQGDYKSDGFDMHQAWAELRCPLGLALRIGRQEIVLDNERLVGAGNWTDQGRALNAINFTAEHKGLTTKLFWARIGEKDVYQADDKGNAVRGTPGDIDLGAVWLRYGKLKAVRPSIMLIYDRNGSLPRNRFTLGAYLEGEPAAGLFYSGEFFYQTGWQDQGAAQKTIAAFMGAVKLGYTLPVKLAPMIQGWFEYLSGDDDAKDDKLKTFDTLYGTNHKFYGYMDFFLNLPKDTANMGLMDLGGRLQVSPAKGFTVWADFHYFWMGKKLSTPAGGVIQLGPEVDLVVNYRYNKLLGAQAGFGVMVPTRGMTCIRGGCRDDRSTETFGYVMGDVTF